MNNWSMKKENRIEKKDIRELTLVNGKFY